MFVQIIQSSLEEQLYVNILKMLQLQLKDL